MTDFQNPSYTRFADTFYGTPIAYISFAVSLADSCHGNAPLTLAQGSVIFGNLISELNSISISRLQLKLSPFLYVIARFSPKSVAMAKIPNH